jgi:twinkle protein
VSLINGAGTAGKDLARLAPKIKRHFKDISFCFDDDDAGHKATVEAMKVFPDATTITLPCKDANACLIEGSAKAAFNATTFNAAKPKNSRIIWLDEVFEEAKEQAEYGVSLPWDNPTAQTRGIRKGETHYFGAGPKMGKSELVNALGAHLVGVHGWKILMAKPEEANKKTAKLLAGKIASTKFHDPNVEFDEEAYDRAGKVLLGEKVALLNIYQHLGWESLKQDIIAAVALGIDAVFIDPITNLTNGMSSADANVKLQEIAQELSAMAIDLNIVVFIFCHLRNPDAGPEHNRGGVVLSNQFAGSRAMARSCNYMWGLEGDKDPELSKEERNVRKLVLLEDREFGEVGVTSLYWDENTTQFNEMRE